MSKQINAEMKNELILQLSNECVMFSSDALHSYEHYDSETTSIQFLNFAYQSLRAAQPLVLESTSSNLQNIFQDFYNQFIQFSRELLWSIESAHSIDHPKAFLDVLKELFTNLKSEII